MLPRTKIVATMGPACWDEPTLQALLQAGVSVARFNFSHAEHTITAEKVAVLRRLSAALGANLALLADLQGPRIRVGALPPAGLLLRPGTTVTLSTRSEPGTIPVDYSGLPEDVTPGAVILLDDGLLTLEVLGADPAGGRIACRVTVGGLLTAHKGINVPGCRLRMPTLTEEDRADLRFALAQGMDLVALSFVRSGDDIREARRLIATLTDRPVPIIAKIENQIAVADYGAILQEADAIMVARGDMGVELPPEELPGIQKRLIAAANQVGKPVITATQMLDSMIRNPRPTRAEVTDVANAVLDGSDAVMLSGETATGAYPLAAVQTMARVALAAERLFNYEAGAGQSTVVLAPTDLPPPPSTPRPVDRAISQAVCEAADWVAEKLGAAAILTLTRSGASAREIAKHRPRARLIAVTDQRPTQRALAMSWGVEALVLDASPTRRVALAIAEQMALDRGLIAPGDLVVLTGSLPLAPPGPTSSLQVRVAGTASVPSEGAPLASA